MTKTLPTIFVVDDEPVIAETLAVILRRVGLDVQAFSDPRQALNAAQLRAPHLLLSDVIMPGMTGVELALQIRAIFPPCKVLLFSGQAKTAELLTEAAAAGHNFELLLKPIHPKDLLAKLSVLEAQPSAAEATVEG